MPLPTHTNIDERLRKSFEANMLDGDTIEDCGSSLLDAKGCFEFFSAELHTIIAEREAEMVKEIANWTHNYHGEEGNMADNLAKNLLSTLGITKE